MLVMLICMIVGAMFFRWLQDEDYMKNFGAIIGSFTGFIIGLLLSIAIGLAVVPTTTTKIEEYNITKYYIDDNKLYYVGEDGTMGRIDIDNGNKDNFEKYGAEVNLKKTINADLTILFLGYVKKIRVKNLKILLNPC